ncbi:MAG: hypothetical protein LC107_06505 [Chitinophagales bacterium]|nr:hypothetical protein [Chitinophagales bacterium]
MTKSFWSRPEGILGLVVLGLLSGGILYLTLTFIGAIAAFVSTQTGAIVSLLVLGTIIFAALDSKTRTLISYMYQSAMRWLTSLFVEIDPMGILRSYIEDMKLNLKKMNRQIASLRGQMHQLKELILNNKKEINTNLNMASEAAQSNKQAHVILKTRKAGRLQDSNMKLEDLYKKMDVLYRVLNKMYENSEVLVEDVQDQIHVKEQERKAIMAGHSAIKSAMSVIKGDPDKKAMFDASLEMIAEDVSQKVGEMERFMDLSQSFMQSIDLQNGIFEEEGLAMLEKWENESISLLLGGEKDTLLKEQILDINESMAEPELRNESSTNQYDNLFK